MRKFFLILTICLLCVPKNAQSQESPHWLSAKQEEPSLTQKTRDLWHEDFFRHDEVWLIVHKERFLVKLRKQGLSSELEKLLQARLKTEFTVETEAHCKSFFGKNPTDVQAYAVVDPEFKALFPPTLLAAVHEFLLATGLGYPLYLIGNKADFVRAASEGSFSKAEAKTLAKKAVQTSHGLALPVTPDLWKVLPPEEKDTIISKFVRPSMDSAQGKGVSLWIKVDTNSISEIIDYFGFGERRSEVEMTLSRLLSKNKGRPFELPITDFFPKPIRDTAGDFSLVSEANCLNCALNTHRDNPIDKYESTRAFQDAIAKEYSPVPKTDKPQFLDLLVFRDTSGRVLHAAIYLSHEYLYTKNGATRFSPKVIQKREWVESAYSGLDLQRIEVYRHKKLSSSSLKGEPLTLPGLCSRLIRKLNAPATIPIGLIPMI